jgi:hypothetical protein
LQSNFAAYAQTFVMLAPRNVSTTMLTTAKNAHKHVATALKNVEEWRNK